MGYRQISTCVGRLGAKGKPLDKHILSAGNMLGSSPVARKAGLLRIELRDGLSGPQARMFAVGTGPSGRIYRFIRRRFPTCIIIEFTVHNDERAPHCHFRMLLRDKQGRLGQNRVLPQAVGLLAGCYPLKENAKQLSMLQDGFFEFCAEPYGLERGAKGEQIEYASLDKELLVAESELERAETADAARTTATVLIDKARQRAWKEKRRADREMKRRREAERSAEVSVERADRAKQAKEMEVLQSDDRQKEAAKSGFKDGLDVMEDRVRAALGRRYFGEDALARMNRATQAGVDLVKALRPENDAFLTQLESSGLIEEMGRDY